jgi:hypothetical protein
MKTDIVLADSGVRFDAEQHRYWLGDKELKGITSTFVKRINPDEYKDVDENLLKERAAYGHSVHDMIEFCLDNEVESDAVEWGLYRELVTGKGIACIAQEYIVTDGERYASPIDLVYEREDGTVLLADVKTNYAPPLEKATVQLSWYKRQFERMNPGLKVSGLAVIWLRDDAKRGPLNGWYDVKPWSDEMLDALIQCDIDDKPWAPIAAAWGDFPVLFAQVEEEVARIEIALKAAKERQEELRKGLYDKMSEYDIKSFTGERVKLTRVLPTTSKSFDSTRFKKEHPDLYKEYVKETEKSGSLRVTLV